MLRIPFGENTLEYIRRGIVDERLLQMQQSHATNPLVAVGVTDWQIVRPSAAGETVVLLNPAISE